MAVPNILSGPQEESLLAIRDLHVRFADGQQEVHAVRGVSLDVRRGETVAIVGESGSGKSQTVMAVMGLLAANGRATGAAHFAGEELLGRSDRFLNRIRGRRVSMIFQEPMTSLDPLYSIGRQVAETMVEHGQQSWRSAERRSIELFGLVGIADPERRARSYPHELSGGQRQRAMIAMAIANSPDLLIADEPTTALDVTIQAQILDLLSALQRRLGMAILFITHDLGIVRRLAQRVCVMRDGQVVESNSVRELFASPAHAYTRTLLSAEPVGLKSPPAKNAPVVLEARAVSVTFNLRGGGLLSGGRSLDLRAVADVSLTLRQGETVGIVGESGSGKSTLGRALLRLVPAEGTIVFCGKDLTAASEKELRPLRRQMQMVYQDPFGSLSPRMTIGEIVSEGLLVHEVGLTAAARDARAAAALAEVQLDPDTRHRYPHEFSGGQRQRIAIARAMILKPRLVVLDEPTSSLDRTVQRQIIDLLRRLQADYDISYVFISHDLAVIRAMADTVLVMQAGRVVESGATEAVFTRPKTPYTQELMAAAASDRRFGEVA